MTIQKPGMGGVVEAPDDQVEGALIAAMASQTPLCCESRIPSIQMGEDNPRPWLRKGMPKLGTCQVLG